MNRDFVHEMHRLKAGPQNREPIQRVKEKIQCILVYQIEKGVSQQPTQISVIVHNSTPNFLKAKPLAAFTASFYVRK